MISSKFFIINQGMELGDKTPISPLMGAKPSLIFSCSFYFLPLFSSFQFRKGAACPSLLSPENKEN